MKKTKLFTALLAVFMLFPWLGWGQGLEDFTNSNATSGYTDNFFEGNNGVTWTYVASRDENGDLNGSGIDGKALMFRRVADNSAVSSSAISGGIGNFSVKLYKGFTGGGDRQVELFINDISQGLSTPFDDLLEHSFEVNGINISGEVVIKITNVTSKQVIVDDIEWTAYGEGTPMVATPIFTPVGGNYYSPQSVSISTTTPGAAIYYTTDGSDPANTSTKYTNPIVVSTNQTIKAKAYAIGFDPSSIGSATYTFPVINDVSNIAALRAGLADGTIYRLTGEAVLTYQTSARNAKYIQDATGAILIDDDAGKITSTYTIYDGITGIMGRTSLYNGMLQFIPVGDPGAATSTGNTIVPETITLADLESGYQAKLVKIMNTTITETGNFAGGINYTLNDASGTGVLRAQYSDLDYIDTPIPATSQNITGVVLQFGTTTQFIPRSLADFETGSSPALVADPAVLSEFEYSQGNGPSVSQSYNISGSQLTGPSGVITVTGSSSFEVSSNNTTFGTTASIPYTGATLAATPVYVRLKAGLAAGSYIDEVITNSGGGAVANVEVECSGIVMAAEATNHATNFTAVEATANTIKLTWTDAIGQVLPSAYLIKGSTVSFEDISAPVDGIPEVNSSLVRNVNYEIETITFTGLSPETAYFFKIYPYTNSGILIDYKTIPAAPNATATTPATALPLAAWTFDDITAAPSTPTSVAANYGNQLTAMFYADGTNGSSLWASTATSPQLTAFGGSKVNDPRIPQTATNAITLANNSANGQSVVVKFSMTGYENPILTFVTRGTGSGFDTHEWAWSTDGTTFTDFGTNTAVTGSTFTLKTIDMSSIDALDQAADVYLRLTLSGATNASGNNRLDNLVLDATPTTSSAKTLNLSAVRLESLFVAGTGGLMNEASNESAPQFGAGIADVITVELHNATTYATIEYTATMVMLSTGGIATVVDIPATFSGSYYVTIKHRNSVEITSAQPVDFSGGSISYAFDTKASCYGGNLKLVDGFYCIYAGDVNQDGIVDISDMTLVDNDASNFTSGYLTTDINGDSVVDISDMTIIDNNASTFTGTILP